jgi:hypothetical protein
MVKVRFAASQKRGCSAVITPDSIFIEDPADALRDSAKDGESSQRKEICA